MNHAMLEKDFREIPSTETYPNSGPVYPNQNHSPSQQKQPIIMQPMGFIGGRSPQKFVQQNIQPGPAGFYGGPQQVNSYSLTNSTGLEYLASIDRLFVKQKIELLETFLGCETNNKYKIYDSYGREMFYAQEDTDCCTRNVCGPLRPFDMIIKDVTTDQEVIHLTRPLACGSCCFPCCLQSLQVFAPPGNLVGSIEQEWSFCIPKFRVKDAQGETMLHIKGPCLTISCCNDVEFNVLSLDKSIEVGKISKHWSGLTREVFTDADNFGLSFPIDLDVKLKAVLIGACMLIDFMYFESSNNSQLAGFFEGTSLIS